MKYYNSSSFKLFFKDLHINTPQILNKVKSLGRLKGLTPIRIFLNYMNRHGKKHFFSKLILNSFIYNFSKSMNIDKSQWQLTFIIFTNFFQNISSCSNNLHNFGNDLDFNSNKVNINSKCLSILKKFKFNFFILYT